MIDPTERVAIVGLGGVFAGSPDPSRFWENVARGVDATTEVPPGRWAVEPPEAFDPAVAAPDRVYATRGGFVEGFAFDPEGLDLDPDLARRLDPSFQLALHAGRAAWRDAATSGLDRSRVGVVFGQIVLPTESASALARETLGRRSGAGPLTEPLNRHAAGLPAGVLARALGLGGGAFTLDAACASSLYALRLAADDLLAGRADAVLTGGVSRPDPLYTQMGFSQLRALSPEGKARPFDSRAGGLVVGEGAGMFVLKRLGDALRDGDHVYALVAAVGLSNDVDGGLLAPSREGQLRALTSAYDRAGWDPKTVDLIECHATGTPLGDAVEFGSLRALWGDAGLSPGGCVIGSHKANVGHALTAAGAAGLLKVVMALRHDTLPPTPNFSAPADGLDYDGGPFRVLTEARPWPRPADGRPRRAAVSGFGFGGINAHALIEEWVPGSPTSPTAAAWVDPEREAEPEAVAIVGLSAHVGPFAGLRAFQERVLGGGDRVRATGYHLDSIELPVDRFRIPPKELAEMLPQQSLLLNAAADAIADAGWGGLDRPRTRAGVVVGITLDPNTTNYHVRWTADDVGDRDAAGPPLSANRTMGALGGLVASRVAREFRLGGPSFTVSSEETSGLRAVDVAARLLRLGEIDEAVVGAVDLTGDPRVVAAARRAGLPGLARSDAAAALVLKRLVDAERDGDRVYAVVRGLGSASGGAIDAAEPDPAVVDASARLAADEAGADPSTLGAFEGSGSERQSAASGAPRPPDGLPADAAVGSAPAEVGHAGAASGLLALVKAALGLHQQILKPAGAEPRFWLHDRADGPRRALVGASGVDGGAHHVVLEEAPRSETARVRLERVQPLGASRSALFAVEADDPAGLLGGIDALERLDASEPGLPVEALARRWFALRGNDPSRRLGLAVVAGGRHDLAPALAEARRRVEAGGERRSRLDRPEGVHYREPPLGPGARVAFVFPGIGNQFAGMGRGLSVLWPEVFRKMGDETFRLRSQLAPGAGWGSDEPPRFEDQRAPIMGQVVLGTAVHDVLGTLGVRPDAVIGYSLGESSALFATRAWTERDLMHARLDASPLFRTDLAGPCEAARRAWKLPAGEPADWVAGIVAAPAGAVREALADISWAYLLIANTPSESVVGGRRREVARLVERLGGPFLPLPVVSTVHCEIARQVEGAYRALHLLETTPPAGVDVYSAGWGRAYTPTRETAAEAVVAQALETVDFPAVVRRAYDDGVRAFVECGPGASCSRMVRAVLGDLPHLARSACVPGEDALGTVLDLVGRLIADRVPVDLAPLYGRETPAAGLAPATATASKTVTVPVGARTVERPAGVNGVSRQDPRPAAVNGRPPRNEPNLDPTVSRPSPDVPDAPTLANPGEAPAPAPPTLPEVAGGVAVLDEPGGADPVARQVYATELGRLRAHAAYLRSANGLGQTLANHLAFQLALVDALSAPPGEAIAVDRPPALPERAVAPGGPPPFMDRGRCLEYAVGSIGRVLGAKFAGADAFPTRVRLPGEPLMLVDRVVEVEGEPLSMTRGRVVTEHDVLEDGWYLDGGKIPTSLAVESGQADLFLSGYLGIDFRTRGLAVYRLLDAVVTFHRGLPGPGEVIRYDIRIHEFFRQDETYLFRFGFEATVGGEPLLTMRDGCAGFFSEAELASGRGIVRRPIDLRPLPGVRPDDWSPLAPTGVESYDDRQIDALRRGDHAAAFGAAFEGLGLRDPLRLPGGRLALLNRIPHLDPAGGRYGLGLVRSELDIHPDDWFLACHFVDDQVMPGTLMYECCLHTLRVYLTRLGWVAESDGAAWEPVPGVSSRLKCRGQVVGTTKKAVFELSIKEVGYRPEPYAVADALMYADGKAIVEVVDMSVRLTGVTREQVERLWRGRPSATAPTRPALYDRSKILAFAEGKPSEAFGDRYEPFDAGRSIARLPAPPFSFVDRVVEVEGEPWVMAAGASALAEYDVPADAWYFDANRQERMPFAVLLEASLQVCGWLAAYMGSALNDDRDLKFRNLGGTATLLADVTRETGTLTTRATTTRVSRSGGMIIQHFAFETSAGPTPVYRGETYFGFFRKEALAEQVGIRDASTLEPTADEAARARSFDYPRGAPFPDDRLRMIDRVDAFVADGGPQGLGGVVGSWAVDPSAWFFRAHFVGDPVCPGSLGLESFLQLLKVWAFERWGAAEFEPVGVGAPHAWVYRGQVLPGDRRVTTRAAVTAVDDDRRWLKADGRFEVDGRLIYRMDGFTLRAV